MPPFEILPSHGGLLEIEPRQLQQLLATKPFKFIVGHNGAEFYINRGFVSYLSAPLNALVNGRMKESLEGCAILEDVDDYVFSRFIQFVYTSDYSCFPPTEGGNSTRRSEGATKITANVGEKLTDNLFSAPLTTRNDFHSYGFPRDGIVPPEPRQKSVRSEAFKLPYSLASYKMAATEWISRPHSSLCKHFQFKPSSRISSKRKFEAMACDCDLGIESIPSEKKRDFISAFVERGDLARLGSRITWRNSEVEVKAFEQFIGHAKMWVFGDRYAIASLTDRACSNLAHELMQWTISEAFFIPDFGGLVRYVYDDRTVGGCKLRQLVAQFAACVVEDVFGLGGWLELLNEVPDFAADLVKQMISRLD